MTRETSVSDVTIRLREINKTKGPGPLGKDVPDAAPTPDAKDLEDEWPPTDSAHGCRKHLDSSTRALSNKGERLEIFKKKHNPGRSTNRALTRQAMKSQPMKQFETEFHFGRDTYLDRKTDG